MKLRKQLCLLLFFNIGKKMMSVNDKGYALPFEVISILLLAALVGCIVIAMKSKPEEQ